MDPWLERPSLGRDVHKSLITAIRDRLNESLPAPYYVGVEERVYSRDFDELFLVGRTDLTIGTRAVRSADSGQGFAGERATGVVEVDVPRSDPLRETYLEIRDVESRSIVTVIELLSPTNKLSTDGRAAYEAKRVEILGSLTSLVEIDLLRAGRPMPVEGPSHIGSSDYRILVSRAMDRPRAKLHRFGVRDAIPEIDVPLAPEDGAISLDVGDVLRGVYRRARYSLRVDYDSPPVPPLDERGAEWARERVREAGRRGE